MQAINLNSELYDDINISNKQEQIWLYIFYQSV